MTPNIHRVNEDNIKQGRFRAVGREPSLRVFHYRPDSTAAPESQLIPSLQLESVQRNAQKSTVWQWLE
ncbi:hypothetical protein MHYP_G00063210 [Metynnis hypsauchen]